MFNFTTLPPLSLYVHIPWCVRKCPYCDFNSHEARSAMDEGAYVDALLADLEQELQDIWGRRVISIFIGGGTPSLFSAEAIDRLLAGIRARLNLSPKAEVTLEANPGTVEADRFAEFRAVGVNRLSIGVQSFNPAHLEALGRIHDRGQAVRAAEAAHRAGFDNFNLDLMFGLPGQSLDDGRSDVQTAIALDPSHISYYQLTIEPNTVFYSRPPRLPEHDSVWEIYSEGRQLLEAAGYGQYEVSAYGRPGKQCRHNLNYWHFGDYIGVGAGAHGKISSAAGQSVLRRWKVKVPRHYLEKAGDARRIGGESQLTPSDALFDFMLNALRLTDGFTMSTFVANTGLSSDFAEPLLTTAVTQGFLTWDAEHGLVIPTQKGRLFLDDALQIFLP